VAEGERPSPSLGEVALLFLRLGTTAFGGPVAHVALMEAEIVRKRRWVTPERFLDLLGAANLIPGPSSTELAIFLGYEQAGVLGLLVAGVCFILPAALIVGLLAWAYVAHGAEPAALGVLYGVKPIVLGVIAQALMGLLPKALKRSPLLGATGVAAGAAFACGVDALVVLVVAGALVVVARGAALRSGAAPMIPALAALSGGGAGAVVVPASLGLLFLTFLKVGALVFGSGYVLLAFLRAELVDKLHWLTDAQLVDAVASGQVTPGPVFTTATFIGYLVAGPWGAAAATVGIFLPGFVLVGVTRPLLARVRGSKAASAALDGVNVASLALMAVVSVQIARASIVDVPTALLAMVGAVLLVRYKVGSTWLVAGGALAGVALHALRS
jgi:chromate transporter